MALPARIARASFIVLLTTACGDGIAPVEITTVRDSAGVHIVEFDSAAQSRIPHWIASTEPDLHVRNREDDPRYQMFFVNDALAVPGGIAVSLNGPREIRIYDDNGEYVRTIGGPGSGPGEFASATWLQKLGPDTIVVYDRGHRRLSVFDIEGRLVRDVPLHRTPATLERPPMQGPQPRGYLPDGSILVALYVAPERLDGPYRPPVILQRYAADGEPADSLAAAWGDDIYIVPQEGGRAVVTVPPFFRVTGFLMAPDGFWVAGTDTWELRRYDGKGRLRGIVRRRQDGEVVTAEVLESYIDERVAGYPEGPQREEARALARRVAVHRTLPAYETAHVADDERIWVRDYRLPPGSSSEWTVFSKDGELVARATLPAGLRPLRFAEDNVIGVLSDSLDRETVARYRFVVEDAR